MKIFWAEVFHALHTWNAKWVKQMFEFLIEGNFSLAMAIKMNGLGTAPERKFTSRQWMTIQTISSTAYWLQQPF